MKKLVMLTLALLLISCVAMAVPYCSCEICAEDMDQTCQSLWTGLFHPCATYYGTYCRG